MPRPPEPDSPDATGETVGGAFGLAVLPNMLDLGILPSGWWRISLGVALLTALAIALLAWIVALAREWRANMATSS